MGSLSLLLNGEARVLNYTIIFFYFGCLMVCCIKLITKQCEKLFRKKISSFLIFLSKLNRFSSVTVGFIAHDKDISKKMSIEKSLIRHSFLKINTCFISECDATKSKVSWWGILSSRRVVSLQTALKPRIESFDHVVVLQSAVEEWVIGGSSSARFRDIKKQQTLHGD